FRRHLLYGQTFVRLSGLRLVAWQIPLGNTLMRALDDTWGHYQDNRVQWLLGSRTHLAAYARAGYVGFLFGGGADGTTCACDARHDGVTNPAPIDGNTRTSLSGADDRDERRDVDHRAAAALAQVGDAVLAAEEDALRVDGLDAVPGLDRRVEDRGVVVGRDPGVVVEDVDTAEPLGRGAHHRRDLLLVGDVHLECEGRAVRTDADGLLCGRAVHVRGP